MDNHSHVLRHCGICGNERVYKDYHNLYSPCKICVAKNSARHYQAKKDKRLARSTFYRENTKYVRKTQTQPI